MTVGEFEKVCNLNQTLVFKRLNKKEANSEVIRVVPGSTLCLANELFSETIISINDNSGVIEVWIE